MNTSNNIMKNLKPNGNRLLVALLTCLLAIACETEIPETDVIPPEFTFQITGDGFSETFDQDTDFSSFQLNLREDTDYDFILSGSDVDGLKRIEWYLAHDYIELESEVISPWSVTASSALVDVVSWNGNRNNPVTGSILAGTFRTRGNSIGVRMTFYLTDFGGESGRSNSSSGELNILIGDHDTEKIQL